MKKLFKLLFDIHNVKIAEICIIFKYYQKIFQELFILFNRQYHRFFLSFLIYHILWMQFDGQRVAAIQHSFCLKNKFSAFSPRQGSKRKSRSRTARNWSEEPGPWPPRRGRGGQGPVATSSLLAHASRPWSVLRTCSGMYP